MMTSRSHHPLPHWLKTAIDSPSYIDDAWSILAAREQQRAFARSASSRPRKHPRFVSLDPTSFDPALAHHYSVSVGSNSTNKLFNRYSDVVPYDRNRVIPPGSEDRYLNASWIQTRSSGQLFIATQAPLLWTANAFLSLMVDKCSTPQGQEFLPIRTIVQLTPEYEGGIRKADPYFPSEIGRSWSLEPENETASSPLTVELLSQSVREDMDCIQSELLVQSKGEAGQGFRIAHLLFTAWPDHGVPQNPESLLRFVRHAEEVNSQGEGSQTHGQRPMVVGCSAGIGRTGSFITISSLLRIARLRSWKPLDETAGQPPSLVNAPELGTYSEDLVVNEIDWLREQRGGMVQKREQMELIYHILSVT